MDVRLERLYAGNNLFSASFIKVLALDIADELKQKIMNTKNVGKSKPCIFEVRSDEILIDFEKVMEFKIAGK